MVMLLESILVAAAAAAQTHWVPLNSQQAKQDQGQVVAPAQAVVPAAVAPVPARSVSEVLTNDTVISLVKAGLGPDTIEAKISASRTSFDTSTSSLIALKQAGVPDSVIAAMLNRSKSSVAPNAVADNSNPEPLVAHAPGIYVLDARGSGQMVRIDPTISNQLKTSNLWGYALTSGLSSMKMKAVIPNPTARVHATSRRPVFYFYFNQSSTLASFSDFSTSFTATATSPNEFSLIRFDPKKDRREASVASVNILSGMKSGISDKARVQFTYDDVAPGVFKVMPTADLAPGEYGFMYSIGAQAGSTARIFDFSIG
jgi:hypothetical protein